MLTTTAPIVSPAELDRLHFSMDANPGSVVVVAKARGECGARFITIGDQNAYACVGRASVFEVGSVTKTLTGLLLADMVRTGDVTLDDPLDAYLPAGIHAPRYGAARAITLRDLATHRSGLPDIPPQHSLDASWYTTFGENDLFAFLSTYRPSHAPGEAYEYSNIGVGLLAIALARRAHTGYAELIRERILEPLGMRDTTIPPPYAPGAALVSGHDELGHETAPWSADALAGAVAARSTAEDLVRLVSACLPHAQGPVAEDCRVAMTPIAPSYDGAQIGLTWNVDNARGVIWHDGDTPGYHAFIGIAPRSGEAAVLLTNARVDLNAVGFHMLDRSSPLPAYREVAIPSRDQRAFVGCYRFAGDTLTVSEDDHGLWYALSHGAGARLRPVGTYSLASAIGSAVMTFSDFHRGRAERVTIVLEGNKIVTGLRVHDAI